MVTLTLLTLLATARADFCAGDLGHALDPMQVTATRRAARGGYEVRVLSKLVEGETRTVVLAGQPDRHDERLARAGLRLDRDFADAALTRRMDNITRVVRFPSRPRRLRDALVSGDLDRIFARDLPRTGWSEVPDIRLGITLKDPWFIAKLRVKESRDRAEAIARGLRRPFGFETPTYALDAEEGFEPGFGRQMAELAWLFANQVSFVTSGAQAGAALALASLGSYVTYVGQASDGVSLMLAGGGWLAAQAFVAYANRNPLPPDTIGRNAFVARGLDEVFRERASTRAILTLTETGRVEGLATALEHAGFIEVKPNAI